MFIHWGLYSVLAGEWKGQKMDYIGEWIMNKYKIPIREYEKIAKQFNPTGFNADNWVSLAKKAGMKYLVFTAKHHDGFAMYHSKADPYNIVDATDFGRDPIAELAAACKKYDVRLCLYYSQALDWHEKDAGGIGFYNSRGYHGVNDWDFPDHSVTGLPYIGLFCPELYGLDFLKFSPKRA
jgi:alpha-L-fucosidase